MHLDYDPQVGRYIESDPIGQRVDVDFSNSFMTMTQYPGYWNHLYNYVDSNPTSRRDPLGLGWFDRLLDLFKDKAPEVGLSTAVGSGLYALCITRNCGKSRSYIDLYGDCASFLSEWVKKHPEIIGAIGGITSDGAQAAVSDCAELCAKGIKHAGACGCSGR